MKNLMYLFLLFISIRFMGSCSFSVSTAQLNEVQMCAQIDSEGLCETDNPQFPATAESFHLTTKLDYAPEDTKVTFRWFGYDQGQKVLIDEVTLRAGDYGSGSSYNLHSSLTRSSAAWPTGDYEVVISLDTDNHTPETKKFTVI